MSLADLSCRRFVACAMLLALTTFAVMPSTAVANVNPHVRRIFGMIVSFDLTANTLVLQRRNGKQEVVDISIAAGLGQLGIMPLHRAVLLYGLRGTDGIFHVQSIGHAPPTSGNWANDSS